jgi:glycosyltransferase involved in cell wall biosynthesis
VRVLIDYRPALRERSGAGEYTHQLVRALARRAAADRLELTVFSSSWKDRFTPPADLDGVAIVDRRVPVSALNFAWHRLGWPPAETVTGSTYDVTHSSHPLILPARRAAQVITIHDLDFLAHPERTRAEIRRDYPALARRHAQRADAILVPSRFTAAEVERQLGVDGSKIAVCPAGAPPWAPRSEAPREGYLLFVGTLEPRKNVGGLLDAYEILLHSAENFALQRGRASDGARSLQASDHPGAVPELVIAGKATAESQALLDRIARPPLRGTVRHVGYVEPALTRELYAGAAALVMPSFEEGFGIPVLEAMTVGVPVVAARRGSLPEVLGDAGLLIEPDRPREIADAVARILNDAAFAAACRDRGLARSQTFQWDATAERVSQAYRDAVERHAHRD